MKRLLTLCSLCFLLLTSFAQSAGPGSAKTIRFGWTANTTEPDLAGYMFYYGIVSSGITNSMPMVTTNTITLNNLPNGNYWFAVTAKNTNNLESAYSNIVLASVPRNPSNLTIQ